MDCASGIVLDIESNGNLTVGVHTDNRSKQRSGKDDFQQVRHMRRTKQSSYRQGIHPNFSSPGHVNEV